MIRARQIIAIALTAAMLLLLPACRPGSGDGDLASIKAETARRFPNVSEVDAQQVADWLDAGEVVLLDVREQAEFDVSHLRGAVRVSPDASSDALSATALANVKPGQRIVLYCAVGVRSAKMAQRLQDAGYTNVHNLNGAIFEWVNEGRPVYRGDEQVDEAHPYNEQWGRLLNPRCRADVEPID